MSEQQDGFREWCILELMGHRRLGGLVTEAEIGGIPLLRIDIPAEPPVTQYYGKPAVYALTPATEELATALARGFHGPVSRYELPAVPAPDPGFRAAITEDGDLIRRDEESGGWLAYWKDPRTPGGKSGEGCTLIEIEDGEPQVFPSIDQAAEACAEMRDDIPF